MKIAAASFLICLLMYFTHCFLCCYKEYKIHFDKIKTDIKKTLHPYLISTKIVAGRIIRLSFVLSILYLISTLGYSVFVAVYIVSCNVYQNEPIKKPIQKEEKTIINEINVDEDLTIT
jgi:hypothetical protein